eukprot:TRINITY_DN12714_c0_g2_i1.p1 TRINITY_DN12714_c0_g2~~TRINITY_DN12714_c0_g2_i1.p1  ORF type:complete len:387 (+),score=-93.86 TRINITY_DN12714_c0_g2_i1:63-1223(+)
MMPLGARTDVRLQHEGVRGEGGRGHTCVAQTSPQENAKSSRGTISLLHRPSLAAARLLDRSCGGTDAASPHGGRIPHTPPFPTDRHQDPLCALHPLSLVDPSTLPVRDLSTPLRRGGGGAPLETSPLPRSYGPFRATLTCRALEPPPPQSMRPAARLVVSRLRRYLPHPHTQHNTTPHNTLTTQHTPHSARLCRTRNTEEEERPLPYLIPSARSLTPRNPTKQQQKTAAGPGPVRGSRHRNAYKVVMPADHTQKPPEFTKPNTIPLLRTFSRRIPPGKGRCPPALFHHSVASTGTNSSGPGMGSLAHGGPVPRPCCPPPLPCSMCPPYIPHHCQHRNTGPVPGAPRAVPAPVRHRPPPAWGGGCLRHPPSTAPLSLCEHHPSHSYP